VWYLPELPDVETLKRYFAATSLHKTVRQVEVKSPEILGNTSTQELRDRLVDHEFQCSRRYGKHLFAEINDDSWFILHFGMTGGLKYFKHLHDEPSHSRLLIAFSNGFYLAYHCQRKLGEVNLAKDVDGFVRKKDLGPDVLDLDFQGFRQILAKRRGTIKYTLMNQHIMAGIGNIYSDEILFQSGIHPKTKVDKLNRKMLEKIFRTMQDVLSTAIENQADVKSLPDDYLTSHRSKEGQCPLDHNELKRVKISGRTAYYCPKHQKKVS
jgi:formamidopyrimidine-DNA glycosylase